jgi:acyl-CoA reductase-like NAD-dependent aldehyde dehydrogenase
MSTIKQALHKTGRLPEVQRIEVLQKLADLVGAEHEDFSRLIANEGGKPIRDARVEVQVSPRYSLLSKTTLRNISGFLINKSGFKLYQYSKAS